MPPLASLAIKFRLTSQEKELHLVMFLALSSFLIPAEHPAACLLAVLHILGSCLLLPQGRGGSVLGMFTVV